MPTGSVKKPQSNETTSKAPRRHFKMIKDYSGSLLVKLYDYELTGLERKFRIGHNEDFKYVPVKWALGVFVSDNALKQMELGYFTFEDLDELIQMAEEEGLYVPDPIKESKISLKDIKKALRSNTPEKLKEVMENAKKKDIDDLITQAKKQYSMLNMQIVEYIEQKYKVSLKPINLD